MMLELTLKDGGRIAILAADISVVMELKDGCRVMIKTGWAVEVVETFDAIGNENAWGQK